MRDLRLEQEIDSHCSDLKLISNIFVFEELESTNKHAFELANNGSTDNNIIIAKRQTQGYGRMNRSWCSFEGDLALSFIFKFSQNKTNYQQASLLAFLPALAVVDALKTFKISIGCKWPNDLVFRAPVGSPNLAYFGEYRKLGGILVENTFEHSCLNNSVIGIGLNLKYQEKLVSQVPHAGFLDQISSGLSYVQICSEIIKNIDDSFSEIDKNSHKKILDRYSKFCVSLGRKVCFFMNKHKLLGTVTSISCDGALLVQSGHENFKVHAGDVNFCA